jgi:Fic family protein
MTEKELLNTLQDLPPVESFAPTGVTKEMLAQIDEYLSEINNIRDHSHGLPSNLVEQIQEKFLADRVRNSATIEGATLDRRETLHVLTTGQIIDSKRRPSEEVRNLGHAIEQGSLLVAADTIREVDIRSIHSLLMEGLDDHVGKYRPLDVKITNATYRPPEHLDVPRLMAQYVDALRLAERENKLHGFTIGVYAHWAFSRIHPFVDGNGRMARILQDVYFLRHNLVPAPISFQQVDAYYEALQSADSGDVAPLNEFVANATLESLQKYRAAIEDFQREDSWLDDLVESVNASVKDAEHASYTRYMQRIGELREVFQEIGDKLNVRVPEIDIRIRKYSPIDLVQYRQLKNTGSTPKSWNFGIEFSYGERRVKFMLWHGRCFNRPPSTPATSEPALLVSIHDGEGYRTLDDVGEHGISLRAVEVVDGDLRRIRYNPVTNSTTSDEGVQASVICKDFIQEVLRSKFQLS